jgi:hypothetical protein
MLLNLQHPPVYLVDVHPGIGKFLPPSSWQENQGHITGEYNPVVLCPVTSDLISLTKFIIYKK